MGFEPMIHNCILVFKTNAINHSTTHKKFYLKLFYAIKDSNLYSSPCKRDALPIKLIASNLYILHLLAKGLEPLFIEWKSIDLAINLHHVKY